MRQTRNTCVTKVAYAVYIGQRKRLALHHLGHLLLVTLVVAAIVLAAIIVAAA